LISKFHITLQPQSHHNRFTAPCGNAKIFRNTAEVGDMDAHVSHGTMWTRCKGD